MFEKSEGKEMSKKCRECLAVDCVNVCFEYSNQKNLDNVNVNVKRGQIYALLGPSGCGKTTLLKNILGRLQPDSGHILVFGFPPNSTKSDIPGSGVGYMPQEFGLMGELTIKETLTLFGKLFHLNTETINNRIDTLVQLLDLPDKNRRVDQISGGEQRRVSVATALIHKPPLLVLDEPTVGVDSELRHSIWKHLISLTQDNTTVIITTHYLEEARSAHTVAMMRKGRILVQDNPDLLIEKYQCSTLIKVFLKLCDDDAQKRQTTVIEDDVQLQTTNSLSRKLSEPKDLTLDLKQSEYFNPKHKGFNFDRVSALAWKNVLFIKKPMFFVLLLLLPIFVLFMTNLVLGSLPKNLRVTVFNEEPSNQLGKTFINNLDKKMLAIRESNSLQNAIDDVIRGESWLAIHIPENFSWALDLRLSSPKDADDFIIDSSTIKLYPDMTSWIGLFIHRSLTESFNKFSTDYLINEKKHDINSVTLPIQQHIIYGQNNDRQGFEEFFTIGLMIFLPFAMLMVFAGLLINYDTQSSLTDRILVAGCRPSEIVVAYIIILMSVVIVQAILLMITAFFILDIPCRGPLVEAFALMAAQFFEGATLGLFLGIVNCKNVVVSIITIFFVIAAVLLTPTIIWPLESAPGFVVPFIKFYPLTIPIDAFRSILFRGWSVVNHWQIIFGFSVAAAYIIVAFFLAVVIFKRRCR